MKNWGIISNKIMIKIFKYPQLKITQSFSSEGLEYNHDIHYIIIVEEMLGLSKPFQFTQMLLFTYKNYASLLKGL